MFYKTVEINAAAVKQGSASDLLFLLHYRRQSDRTSTDFNFFFAFRPTVDAPGSYKCKGNLLIRTDNVTEPMSWHQPHFLR